MDSSCIQDKCHACALRCVGRASTTLTVSKGACFPWGWDKKRALSKTASVVTFPIFSLAQHFRLPWMPAWSCLAGSHSSVSWGCPGFPSSPPSSPQLPPAGLESPTSPVSSTWLVAAPCFHNYQRDGKLTVQKSEWALCFALWICSFGVLGLGLCGWALIEF